jgi:protein-tyrosine phosphatase
LNRICFVCQGNIIRSPLAKNLFEQLARQAGIGDRFTADSAGTSGWHVGQTPDLRMLRVAARHGLDYDGRARQFQRSDFDRFDLIMAMDAENRLDLLAMANSPDQAAKIHLLREYDPMGGKNVSVPDPYYGRADGFEEVYQVIERSVQGLFSALKDEPHDP